MIAHTVNEQFCINCYSNLYANFMYICSYCVVAFCNKFSKFSKIVTMRNCHSKQVGDSITNNEIEN